MSKRFMIISILYTGFIFSLFYEQVFLRYTPEIGKTYTYNYSVNLNKTMFRKTRNETLQGNLSYSILEKRETGFRVKLGIELISSNMSKQVFERMKDETEKPRFCFISSRYIFDDEGVYNLCFPDKVVKTGDKWTGKCSFNIGDMSSLMTPMVNVIYQLTNIERNINGTLCTIECRQADDSIEVPLQTGMLGIKCDTQGKIISVNRDSDAFGKVKRGDILTTIEGRKAGTSAVRHSLYERYIEPVGSIGKKVKLTILRNGEERTVVLTNSCATIGHIRINIDKSFRTVIFNAVQGIIESDVIKAHYTLTYNFPEKLPFIDDYSGTEPLRRLIKTKLPPRIYDYEWKLTLK